MHKRTSTGEQYWLVKELSRSPHDASPTTYTEWHQQIHNNPPQNLYDAAEMINTLTRETFDLDPRVHDVLLMAKYADAATMLRDIPGGRDETATKNANTTTADMFYAMMKRQADDTENQQRFRGHLSPEQLETSNTTEPEPMQAMSTRLFEEQLAQFPPAPLPAELPEYGTITPPIETGRILDVCRARDYYEKAWGAKNLDEREELLKQSKTLSSGVDAELSLNDLHVLPETRAINKLYLALVRHDLTALDYNDNQFRNLITNEAVLTLWDAEIAVQESRSTTGDTGRLAPYLEKIQHFRRVYSNEIGIDPETRPKIEQQNSSVPALGSIATHHAFETF